MGSRRCPLEARGVPWKQEVSLASQDDVAIVSHHDGHESLTDLTEAAEAAMSYRRHAEWTSGGGSTGISGPGRATIGEGARPVHCAPPTWRGARGAPRNQLRTTVYQGTSCPAPGLVRPVYPSSFIYLAKPSVGATSFSTSFFCF